MRHWQLFAASCWLVIGILLFFRTSLLSDQALAAMQGRNWTVATWLSLFFFAWNLARWYHSYAQKRETPATRTPLRTERKTERPYEYNPEFDFQKSDPPPRDPA